MDIPRNILTLASTLCCYCSLIFFSNRIYIIIRVLHLSSKSGILKKSICSTIPPIIYGLVTLKCVAPSDVFANRFHASHWLTEKRKEIVPMGGIKLISNDIWWHHKFKCNRSVNVHFNIIFPNNGIIMQERRCIKYNHRAYELSFGLQSKFWSYTREIFAFLTKL